MGPRLHFRKRSREEAQNLTVLNCNRRKSRVPDKILGARLCPQDQPQPVEISNVLRLVLRTQPRSFGCGSVALCLGAFRPLR